VVFLCSYGPEAIEYGARLEGEYRRALAPEGRISSKLAVKEDDDEPTRRAEQTSR
jgi:hypothetical protein